MMSDAARERNGIVGSALPCVYLGGCVVFDPKEIELWLKQQPRMRKKPNRGNGESP